MITNMCQTQNVLATTDSKMLTVISFNWAK